jgi:hypothetical protein
MSQAGEMFKGIYGGLNIYGDHLAWHIWGASTHIILGAVK